MTALTLQRFTVIYSCCNEFDFFFLKELKSYSYSLMFWGSEQQSLFNRRDWSSCKWEAPRSLVGSGWSLAAPVSLSHWNSTALQCVSMALQLFVGFLFWFFFATWNSPQSATLSFLMYLLLQAKSCYLICKGPVISSVFVKLRSQNVLHGWNLERSKWSVFGPTWSSKLCRLSSVSRIGLQPLFVLAEINVCLFLWTVKDAFLYPFIF